MVKLQQNRYLWVHIVSLAAVPLLLDVCLAGLASAGPALAFKGQFWAIALLGVTPALAMQWLRPFYVFSLPPLALKPAALSEDQRRCLTIFKSWQIKALAVVVAIFSVWVLGQVYGMLPQVSPLLTPRAGLVCGMVAFFFAATFMQISVSAIRALLVGPDALKRVAEVEEGAIASDFLILGIPVKKLLLERSNPTEAEPPTQETAVPADEADSVNEPSSTNEPDQVEQSTEKEKQADMEQTDIEQTDIEQTDIEQTDIEQTEIVIPEVLPSEEAPEDT